MGNGVPATADPVEIGLEGCGSRHGRSCVLGKEREDRLAARAQMQRRFRADLDGLAHGVATFHLLRVHADGSAHQAERRGLASALADGLQVRQRTAPQVVVHGCRAREQQRLRPEAVSVGGRIGRDVSGLGERDQDAMDDALRAAQPARDLGHAEIVTRLGERVEHVDDTARDR